MPDSAVSSHFRNVRVDSGGGKLVFGFGMFLMALADWLARRKHDGRRQCDVCGQRFGTFEEAEDHRRRAHAYEPV